MMITKMLSSVALVGLFAAASGHAVADELSLTIYGDGQALVIDERDFSFVKGRTAVSLPGVSSQINSASVGFVADNIQIVEQNYDFDLLSPQALMEKSVGETVTLVSVNPGTGKESRRKAKILAVNGGVVIESEGRIEVLRDDGLPTRVIFDEVPDNLRAQPTLSVTVDSGVASDRSATLRYLTTGLSWRADYVAVFDEKAGALDLQGWATMQNGTETTFRDAQLRLVAAPNGRGGRRNIRQGGREATPEEVLGDKKLYTLPGKTTLASQQTKQISIVNAQGVSAEKRYEYKSSGFRTYSEPQNVDVRVAFSNSKAAGMNAAMPAGTVRVYQKDAQGTALFVGEDRIGHVPGGSDISIKTGAAFDITVQPKLAERDVINRRTTDTTMEYLVRNASTEDTEVIIEESVGGYWRSVDMRGESLPSKKTDADTFQWRVPVKAEGETTLTFTIRTIARY
ncbi:MAG: DUF4139 domain-containing protein [Pseudomonadota bacterium]